MNHYAKGGGGDRPYVILAIYLVVACITFPIFTALRGNPIYRDIHLGTAIEYTKSSISFANTIIVGFNATGTPTIQELPLWQMLVAIVFKVCGLWFGWANIVSILIFSTSLIPLFFVGKTFLGQRGGLATLIFFLAQPLVFKYYGLASTDGTALTAAIWFLFLGLRLISAPSFSMSLWLGALIFGGLSALLKLPFFMEMGMALLFYLLLTHPRFLWRFFALGSVGFISAFVFLVWTKYTDQLQSGALFPLVDLRLSNPDMVFWYFGDWHYRLSPANWIKGGWRILNCLFGSFVLVGLAALGMWKTRPLKLPLCLLLAGGFTTMIFSHLVLHHSHYYLMFSPAIAMLCANAFIWLTKSFSLGTRLEYLFSLCLALLLSLSLVQGLIGMKSVLDFDPYPKKIARLITEYTSPEDKILIQGGGWGGEALFLSHRSGLSFWNTKFLENKDTLNTLKNLGYNKLAMISESPLLHALQVVNPGQSSRERESYQKNRTSLVESWPIIYKDADIVIQRIP